MTTKSSDGVSVISVNEEQWTEAQQYEKQTWVVNNRRNGYLKLVYKFLKALKNPKTLFNYFKYSDFYCGDDWNYWWMEKFYNYRSLPRTINRALEVGCGPYTNIRLIAKQVHIRDIYCTDPLMDEYKTFPLTWLTSMTKKGRVHASSGVCEKIDFPDGYFDLVVCNNVLDHVQNAEQGLLEMARVLKPGGYFVFGQDLTNEQDLECEPHREGHPIRLHETFLDGLFHQYYSAEFKKLLPRGESRVSEIFYGTYIFIGKKI